MCAQCPSYMPLTSLQAALLFCRLPKLGPRSVKKLIDHSGDVKNALQQNPDKLLEISGIGKSHLKEISQWKAVLPKLKKEEIFIKKMGLTPYIHGEKTILLPLRIAVILQPFFFKKER